MSILDSVNEVCDVVKLDHFEVVVGSSDPNAQTMLALAKEAGEEICRRVDWNKMLKSATVPASPFDLPEDFQRLIAGGSIRPEAGGFARVVTNGGEWSVIKQVPSAQVFSFIRGNEIHFAPTSAAVNAEIDYVSKNWLQAGAEQVASITADDNEPLFPVRLLTKGIIWRWKRQKGLSYEDQLAEFEADLSFEITADRGASQ